MMVCGGGDSLLLRSLQEATLERERERAADMVWLAARR
jgi:hypothetical protein